MSIGIDDGLYGRDAGQNSSMSIPIAAMPMSMLKITTPKASLPVVRSRPSCEL